MRGLLAVLEDKRFEVRFQTGRALTHIHDKHPNVHIDEAKVRAAVLREVAVDRRVWESQRLLDESEDENDDPFVGALLRERGRRSLEHVFRLLSLFLEKKPLRIAFRGLQTDDQTFKGTALEYLEGILPQDVRESLWPFLEAEGKARKPSRSRDQILADLVRSHASIEMNLAELRRRGLGV